MMNIPEVALAAGTLLFLAVQAVDLPQNLRAMLDKSASLSLQRFPIGFWNYTNLTEHAQYMDEAETSWTTRDVNGSEAMWEFFSRHTR